MSVPLRRVSDSAVRRLSLYLRTLEGLEGDGRTTVSSRELAERSGTSGAQVRKDLSLFGSFGTRGLGYRVTSLRLRLERILGLSQRWRVVLVGAGRLGAALFEYPDFRERGFEIVAVLDSDPRKIGKRWDGIVIQPVSCLKRVLRDSGAEIAILAVPGPAAREVAPCLVEGGVLGILNLAPTQLAVPPSVAVHGVNMAMEIEALSFALRGESGAGRTGGGEAGVGVR